MSGKSGKRYSEEFKREAVKQITERNYPIGQVSKRLGVTTKSLYAWIKRFADSPSQHSQLTEQQREIRELKAQLRRVEEERDILKKAAVDSSEQRNSCTKILICRRAFDETYKAHIYPRRERVSL